MGDLRATIKIEFSMCGIERKADMSINWFAEPGEIDQRVVDFFSEATDAAMSNYHDSMHDWQRKMDEEAERREYERLKAKFAPPTR